MDLEGILFQALRFIWIHMPSKIHREEGTFLKQNVIYMHIYIYNIYIYIHIYIYIYV